MRAKRDQCLLWVNGEVFERDKASMKEGRGRESAWSDVEAMQFNPHLPCLLAA